MPRLDLDALPQENDTGYPQPFAAAVEGRWKRRLASAAGLSVLGATHIPSSSPARGRYSATGTMARTNCW